MQNINIYFVRVFFEFDLNFLFKDIRTYVGCSSLQLCLFSFSSNSIDLLLLLLLLLVTALNIWNILSYGKCTCKEIWLEFFVVARPFC